MTHTRTSFRLRLRKHDQLREAMFMEKNPVSEHLKRCSENRTLLVTPNKLNEKTIPICTDDER
jgi:hypothetical protein